MSSIVLVNSECNLNCVYCSSRFKEPLSMQAVLQQVSGERDQVCFTGGEPLLCKNLLRFIALAKENGVSEIELQSNGTLFYQKQTAKKLVESGVSIFNIALPSHKERVSAQITRTKGLFNKRIEGIKNLLGLGASVRITLVVCSLNQGDLLGFSKFVHREFSGIKLLEFNAVKLKGGCLENKWLVPKLDGINKELCRVADFCESKNINFLVDGVPLCHLQGIESHSVDLIKILNGITSRFHAEKEKAPQCVDCSLNELCLGFRKGYLGLHGNSIAKPSRESPGEFKRLFV